MTVFYVLIGPGGVGKNQMMKEVLAQVNDLKQLATATTRPPRDNELEGREHQFVSLAQFQAMIANNELVEYQEVHPGKLYGVPRKTLTDAIAAGEDLIADLDVLGAMAIQSEFPNDCTLVFVLPPEESTIIDRLINRRAPESDIVDRVNRMPMEMLYAPVADYVIVNDHFDDAVVKLLELISAVRQNEPFEEVTLNLYAQLSVLASDNIPADTVSALVFRQAFERGTRPENVAHKIGQTQFGESFEPLDIQYANPDGSLPFQCTYDADLNSYDLTYLFTATLPEGMALPDHRDG